ncbi:uncharacterized protein LOC135199074 [Macrobrachium nipponense]|uniref:uncharacterized protein LOC135199074 n=1 Tax=Macrobrachium nipponense TaxID=159736 RepID=UPI0030C8205E
MVGVDHTSPIRIEGGVGYLLIITCLTSHYLDYCNGLDADTFVLLSRRFSANNRASSTVYSDNAVTFRRGSSFLREVYEEDMMKLFIRKTGIKWIFQTPRSPWKEGFFERLVRVVKQKLAIALRRNVFTEEQLCMLIKKTRAVITSCPLMYAGDTREAEVLTPSHLIRGDVIRLLTPVV